MLASSQSSSTNPDPSQLLTALASYYGMKVDPAAFQSMASSNLPKTAPPPPPAALPEPSALAPQAPVRTLNFLSARVKSSTKVKSAPNLSFPTASSSSSRQPSTSHVCKIEDDDDEIVEIPKPTKPAPSVVATQPKVTKKEKSRSRSIPEPALLSEPQVFDSTEALVPNPYLFHGFIAPQPKLYLGKRGPNGNGWYRRAGLPPPAARSSSIPPPSTAEDITLVEKGKEPSPKKVNKKRSAENVPEVGGVKKSKKPRRSSGEHGESSVLCAINGNRSSPNRYVIHTTVTSPIRSSASTVNHMTYAASSPVRRGQLALPRAANSTGTEVRSGLVLPTRRYEQTPHSQATSPPSTPRRSSTTLLSTMDIDNEEGSPLFGPSPDEEITTAERRGITFDYDIMSSPSIRKPRSSPHPLVDDALQPRRTSLSDIARRLTSDDYDCAEDHSRQQRTTLSVSIIITEQDMRDDTATPGCSISPVDEAEPPRTPGQSTHEFSPVEFMDVSPRQQRQRAAPSSPLPPSSPPLSITSGSSQSSTNSTPRMGCEGEIIEDGEVLGGGGDGEGDLFDALELELGGETTWGKDQPQMTWTADQPQTIWTTGEDTTGVKQGVEEMDYDALVKMLDMCAAAHPNSTTAPSSVLASTADTSNTLDSYHPQQQQQPVSSTSKEFIDGHMDLFNLLTASTSTTTKNETAAISSLVGSDFGFSSSDDGGGFSDDDFSSFVESITSSST